MLRINRIRIEIMTEDGMHGFDASFSNGLNFLASEENTYGKSSILAAVYYCLGLEEILGGRGEKVLTPAFKNFILVDGKEQKVLQSAAYLEISNGNEIITLYRTAKMENRDTRMITVYYSELEHIKDKDTVAIDTYVHLPNAAKNEKGFHSVLEKFLYLDLPLVTSSDDSKRKLYIQLVASIMFIEQKHGWSDLFSGMPILGIKESKKRVLEYLLNLDTLENENLKHQLLSEKYEIESQWELCYKTLRSAVEQQSCSLQNFPTKPKILSELDRAGIIALSGDLSVEELIKELRRKAESIKVLKPKVVDNFDALQVELDETEKSIHEYELFLSNCQLEISKENSSINSIHTSLETIEIDLVNNKDAARLRNLGSELQCSFSKGICPVCHHTIEDSLLTNDSGIPVMDIDENIRHLEAQKNTLQFALSSHSEHKEYLERELQRTKGEMYTLRRLAQSIRNDLYSVDEDYSEAVVYQKITIEKKIEDLEKLQCAIDDTVKMLSKLSDRWSQYLERKGNLPDQKFTDSDRKKLSILRRKFIDNLKSFGYRSISDLEKITISEESYLPLFEGFDMKFDSSASDNIRVIWAFTLTVLQTSLETDGHHPGVLIYDEPDQQSTILSDVKAFFDQIIKMGDSIQVIMGITIKDGDTKAEIEKLPKDSYRKIVVPNRAFQKLNDLFPSI